MPLWRDHANLSPLDFRRRYSGTVSDHGQIITGSWEICHDGTTWENDFDLTYTKAVPTRRPKVGRSGRLG